jgi:hypothetical protein
VEPKKEPEPRPVPPPKEEPKKEPSLRPVPEPKKEPEPAKQPRAEVLVGRERYLDRPDGEYTVEPLPDRKKIRITGKVRTLKVNLIREESGLDASELEAQEIVVLDRIAVRSRVRLCAPNGKVEMRGPLEEDSQLEIVAPNSSIEMRGKVDVRSTLKVNAPGGRVTFSQPTGGGKDGSKIEQDSKVFITAKEVEFRGKVSVRATVEVTAPDGRVTFSEPTSAGREGSKIDQDSKVTVTAKDVEFHGKVDVRARVTVTAPGGRVTFSEPTAPGKEGSKIDQDSKIFVTAKDVDFRGTITGQNTRAFVTLTRDGSLKFKGLEGTARIEYRKADPSDPEPTVEAGTLAKKWQLQKTD